VVEVFYVGIIPPFIIPPVIIMLKGNIAVIFLRDRLCTTETENTQSENWKCIVIGCHKESWIVPSALCGPLPTSMLIEISMIINYSCIDIRNNMEETKKRLCNKQ